MSEVEWMTTSTAENVNVTAVRTGWPIATASANPHLPDRREGVWWISRVLVSKPENRGKGLGGKALEILCEQVGKHGGKSIIVTPGGYAQNEDQQRRFYEAHDFKQEGEGFSVLWRRTLADQK